MSVASPASSAIPAAAVAAARDLCPSRIHGMAIARTDAPGLLALGSSGTDRPIDDRTIFEIGSLTKTFTALLLADSVVRGELALDDPLARWLPDAAPRDGPRPVTVLDLATHTSRIRANLPGFALRVMVTARSNPFPASLTRQQLARAAAATRPDSALGRRFVYSNIGYALLGLVLEAATGRGYAELLLRRITEPLGMIDTTVDALPGPDASLRLAVGHLTERSLTRPFRIGLMNPAGGLRSTLRDMATYASLHADPGGNPLEAAVRLATSVHRPVVPPRPHRESIGLAWLHDTDNGIRTTWMNGGAMGMGSWLGVQQAAPGRPPRGVVILMNSGWRRTPLLTEVGLLALA